MGERISRRFATIDGISQHSIGYDKFRIRDLLHSAQLLFGDEAQFVDELFELFLVRTFKQFTINLAKFNFGALFYLLLL